MTIPFLSGNADPRQIQQIQENISGIFDPRKPAREALIQATTSNPKLFQQWRDRYKQDPEAVKRMFGNNVSNYFEGGFESAESQVDRTAAGIVASNTPTDAVIAAPGVRDRAAAQQVLGQSPEQVKGAKLANKSAETANAIAEINLDERLAEQPFFRARAQADQTLRDLQVQIGQGNVEAIQRAQGYQQRVAGLAEKYGNTPELVYQAYRAGKMDPEDLVAVFAVPEYRALFEAQQQDYWKKQDKDLSIWISGQGSRLNPDEYLERNMINRAGELSEAALASGTPINTKTFYELLKNPQEVQRLQSLTSDALDPVERGKQQALRFMQVHSEQTRAQAAARARVQADMANNDLVASLKKGGGNAQMEANASLASRNEQLILGSQGFPYNVYRWETSGRNRLIVTQVDPNAPAQPQSTDAIEAAAKALANGEGTLEQLKSPEAGFTPEEITRIQTRAAQLKASKP